MVWADILEIFLNVLEALALIVSVTTFFVLMLNKFSHGLKLIFAPCGLGFFRRLRILFLCRKSYRKKQAFIEFALLKTQGRAVISAQWKEIINAFKGFYRENGETLVYVVPNCTLLIGGELNEAIGRYFSFLADKKVRTAFGISDEILKWVITIRIEEAYATPTCLLTGLLSKYEESWEEFIKKYVSTAYITETDNNDTTNVITSELYMTFAWLLWGPSYEIEYKNYWAGLCQISYGDESNSLPAMANRETDVMDLLREKFEANEGKRYGALLSVDLSVYEKRGYMRQIREFENPDNAYFYDKIKEDETTFSLQIDSFIPCMNYKSKKYYCTAYVWLLFEVESDDSIDFHPERTVAFFEHANLTDKDTYNFLIERLIDKSIKHFEKIYADERYRNRKYRFVAALNQTIEERCKARYLRLTAADNPLADRLKEGVLMDSKRKPPIAFAAFDEYFTEKNEYEFLEVSLENNCSVVDLGQFYTSVYMECFPDADERETFDHLLAYLRQAQNQTEYSYHILLLKDGEQVIGGAIFDYFKRTNSAMIEFLAVKKEIQSRGVGSLIFKKVQLILSYQANRAKKHNVDRIFCEIDSPMYSKASVKKYLYFWNKNNFRHIDFTYIQPALSASQSAVTGLWLAVLTEHIAADISASLLQDILYDYMKYCMQIENPKENAEYLRMAQELETKERVKLLPIISAQ